MRPCKSLERCGCCVGRVGCAALFDTSPGTPLPPSHSKPPLKTTKHPHHRPQPLQTPLKRTISTPGKGHAQGSSNSKNFQGPTLCSQPRSCSQPPSCTFSRLSESLPALPEEIPSSHLPPPSLLGLLPYRARGDYAAGLPLWGDIFLGPPVPRPRLCGLYGAPGRRALLETPSPLLPRHGAVALVSTPREAEAQVSAHHGGGIDGTVVRTVSLNKLNRPRSRRSRSRSLKSRRTLRLVSPILRRRLSLVKFSELFARAPSLGCQKMSKWWKFNCYDSCVSTALLLVRLKSTTGGLSSTSLPNCQLRRRWTYCEKKDFADFARH